MGVISTPGKTRVEDHPGGRRDRKPGVIAEEAARDARGGMRLQPHQANEARHGSGVPEGNSATVARRSQAVREFSALAADEGAGCHQQQDLVNENRGKRSERSIHDTPAHDGRNSAEHQNPKLACHIHAEIPSLCDIALNY
jgi:hypothetical protein